MNNYLDYAWNELDKQVQLYSYKLMRENKHLDRKKLNELIRRRINNKFKKENNQLLAAMLLARLRLLKR